MKSWQFISAFGDSAVLLPCASLLILWLCVRPEARGLALNWALLFLGVTGIVVSSKLTFMAWGLGIQRLNFIGISGHSAMAGLVWPSLLGLAVAGHSRLCRLTMVVSGIGLALLVAISRLMLQVHSVAEVTSGLLIGTTAAVLFLVKFHDQWSADRRHSGLLLAVLVVLPLVYNYRFPSERILREVAQHLSADNTVYTRRYFRDCPE
jgi:membrane-associated phospholipid phosphatase